MFLKGIILYFFSSFIFAVEKKHHDTVVLVDAFRLVRDNRVSFSPMTHLAGPWLLDEVKKTSGSNRLEGKGLGGGMALSPPSGLYSTAKALEEYALEYLVSRVLKHAGLPVSTIPIYGVIDRGFQENGLYAGILVRSSDSRIYEGLSFWERHLVTRTLEAYGITSTGVISEKYKDGFSYFGHLVDFDSYQVVPKLLSSGLEKQRRFSPVDLGRRVPLSEWGVVFQGALDSQIYLKFKELVEEAHRKHSRFPDWSAVRGHMGFLFSQVDKVLKDSSSPLREHFRFGDPELLWFELLSEVFDLNEEELEKRLGDVRLHEVWSDLAPRYLDLFQKMRPRIEDINSPMWVARFEKLLKSCLKSSDRLNFFTALGEKPEAQQVYKALKIFHPRYFGMPKWKIELEETPRPFSPSSLTAFSELLRTELNSSSLEEIYGYLERIYKQHPDQALRQYLLWEFPQKFPALEPYARRLSSQFLRRLPHAFLNFARSRNRIILTACAKWLLR